MIIQGRAAVESPSSNMNISKTTNNRDVLFFACGSHMCYLMADVAQVIMGTLWKQLYEAEFTQQEGR